MSNFIYIIISIITTLSALSMFIMLLTNKKKVKPRDIEQMEQKIKMWEEASWEIVENIKEETEKSLTKLKEKEIKIQDMQNKLEKTIIQKTKEWEARPLNSISSTVNVPRKEEKEVNESKKEKVLKLKEKGYTVPEISQKLDINSGEVRVIFGLQKLKK